MRRRQFLASAGRSAFAFSLLPFVGCASRSRIEINSARSTASRALVAHLQSQIPAWMQESKVPGLSIALINDDDFGITGGKTQIVVLRGTGIAKR